jgi:hypothetical protein
MGFSVKGSCLGCRNKIAFAFFELHSVRITHFVEDFHTAILGFGAVALVPPKAFGVRTLRAGRGCQKCLDS